MKDAFFSIIRWENIYCLFKTILAHLTMTDVFISTMLCYPSNIIKKVITCKYVNFFSFKRMSLVKCWQRQILLVIVDQCLLTCVNSTNKMRTSPLCSLFSTNLSHYSDSQARKSTNPVRLCPAPTQHTTNPIVIHWLQNSQKLHGNHQ